MYTQGNPKVKLLFKKVRIILLIIITGFYLLFQILKAEPMEIYHGEIYYGSTD